MPIYEYECDDCKKVHEISQSMSEAPKTTCPSCSGGLRKLISRSSFQLKGSGWYSDGYSSTAGASKSTASPPPPPASSASSEKTCPKSGAACPCAQ